jgi:hypothetical protein
MTLLQHEYMAPEQQVIVVGDEGQAQDAMHGAIYAVLHGSHEYVVTAGVMYRIGPEPERGQRFGLGYGGRRWYIVWPDGTKQSTRNLWDWGNTDLADNAQLFSAPYWENGQVFDLSQDIQVRIQPPPKGNRTGVFCILETREATHIVLEREWANNKRFPRCLVINEYGSSRISVSYKRLAHKFIAMINAFVCTKCKHWRKDHWTHGDHLTGPIDWGCKQKGCKC